MRTVTCTNNDGSTMIFTETAFSPFYLAYIQGIYETNFDVSVSNNKITDGGTYQGSTKQVRNIVVGISLKAKDNFRQKYRDALYDLFPKGTLGTLTYEENGSKREIDYYVEYVRDMGFNKRILEMSLICPDPFFRATSPESINVASIVGGFEFIHEFTADGEEIGYRSNEMIATFNNDFGVDNVGMTISIRALGAATNPSVVHIQKDERITVGYTAKPLEMERGDELLITTETNNKHVYFIRDGVQTEINEYLTEDSEFIQLSRGINSIGYDADSGLGNLTMNIKYRKKYEGA